MPEHRWVKYEDDGRTGLKCLLTGEIKWDEPAPDAVAIPESDILFLRQEWMRLMGIPEAEIDELSRCEPPLNLSYEIEQLKAARGLSSVTPPHHVLMAIARRKEETAPPGEFAKIIQLARQEAARLEREAPDACDLLVGMVKLLGDTMGDVLKAAALGMRDLRLAAEKLREGQSVVLPGTKDENGKYDWNVEWPIWARKDAPQGKPWKEWRKLNDGAESVADAAVYLAGFMGPVAPMPTPAPMTNHERMMRRLRGAVATAADPKCQDERSLLALGRCIAWLMGELDKQS